MTSVNGGNIDENYLFLTTYTYIYFPLIFSSLFGTVAYESPYSATLSATF
jgi:hypothetical protein